MSEEGSGSRLSEDVEKKEVDDKPGGCDSFVPSGELLKSLSEMSSPDVFNSPDRKEEMDDETDKNKGEGAVLPYDLSKVIKIRDFSRSQPTKEDIVIVLKNGRAKLGFVTRLCHDLRSNPLYKGKVIGTMLSVELIPSPMKVKRCIEEAIVADRGFSLGETVLRYNNEYAPTDQYAIYRSTKQGQIGVIVGARLRGDVLVLPQKNVMVRNVDLTKVKPLELANFNSAHNYILYKEWVGDIKGIVNNITLVYKNYRCVVKENGSSKESIYLARKDKSDEGKPFVKGELVQLCLTDARSKHCKWEKEAPFKVRKFYQKYSNGSEVITCTVEKIETESVDVDWITSPILFEKPDKTLTKDKFGDITPLDLSANPRVASTDRVIVTTEESYEVMTSQQYNNSIDREYKDMFDWEKSKKDKKVSQIHSRSANSSGKTDGCSPQKNAKMEKEVVASVESTRMDTIAEHEDEPSDESSAESDSDSGEEDKTAQHRPSEYPTTGGSSRKIGRMHRMKRARTKRVRRLRQSIPLLTSTKAIDVVGEQFFGEVIFTKGTFDVEWMDGSIECDIPGHSLVPMDPDLDQQDHIPGMIVTQKDGNPNTEMGLILNVDQTDRSANIRWFTLGDSIDTDPQLKGDELCTLFDIMPHPTFERIPVGSLGIVLVGDTSSNDMRNVIFQVKANLKNGKQAVRYLSGGMDELWPYKVTTLFIDEETEETDEETESTDSESDGEEEGGHIEEEEDAKDAIVLNDIIMNLNDSFPLKKVFHEILETFSQMPSSQVVVSNSYMAENPNPDGHEIWKMSRLYSLLTSPTLPTSDVVEHLGTFNFRCVPLSELESLPNFSSAQTFLEEFESVIVKILEEPCEASALLNSVLIGSPGDDSTIPSCYWIGLALYWREHKDIDIVYESQVGLCNESTVPHPPIDTIEEVEESEERPEKEGEKGVFMSLESCSSHTFYTTQVSSSRQWMRRIMSDHKRLNIDLPKGITVVGFSDRLDLLSVLIVGPKGTPFEATPFLFDIQFPMEYPEVPPEVNYVSFSREQLNPNLYQNGKVCTSLLGTWEGKGIEKWGPSSTLIQVLISIQGLILVPEPYFNEAGYESRKEKPEMVAHSKRYNETATINSLEYMQRIYTNPPKQLVKLVREIVKKEYPILRCAMSFWLNDALTPSYPVNMSKGFRMALEKHMKRIDEVIKNNGESAEKTEEREIEKTGENTEKVVDDMELD